MAFQKDHKFGMRFEKGHIPWNKGKKMSYIHGMLGKKHTKEAREKIRKSKVGYKWSIKQREKIEEWRKNNIDVMRRNGYLGLKRQSSMKEPTSIEKKVYEELKNRGFLFEIQKLINGKFLVDAYIPSLNLIIEVDGNYWHSLDRVIKKDKAENAYLKECGYNLLRLTENEINNDSFNLLLKDEKEVRKN